MVKVKAECFSLEKICLSGQCFRFRELEKGKYCVVAFGKYLEIEQNDKEVIFYCNEKEYNEIWKEYFDLNTDYKKYLNHIAITDEYLNQVIRFGEGIRILKQDIWEMIISFIVSQQNNIKRIQKIIELLSQRFGEMKYTQQGIVYYTFPSIECLANATEQDLKDCNLGYRAKYILKTANDLFQNQSIIKSLKNMNYTESKKELMKLYGVGEKVADCICLFSLHHLNAFPIDTHIKSVLQSQYQNGFPFDLYDGYAGVIQQYIFYYDLNKNKIR